MWEAGCAAGTYERRADVMRQKMAVLTEGWE
jgi:hypothetical protein